MSSNTTAVPTTEPGTREVLIAQVWVRDGFNPRTSRDPEAFAQTVASVKATGVLQPILATPEVPDDAADDDPRCLRVVAGEGRYRAAVEAGIDVLPVTVRQADDVTGGLEWAIAENTAREQMDPVAVAHGYYRLKAARWTVKRIAAEFGVSQKLVTERLRIFQIPDGLHPRIADGRIPLSAVKTLAEVAKFHPALPEVLAARVESESARYGYGSSAAAWAGAIESPARTLCGNYPDEDGCQLPDDVYPGGPWERIPLDRLDLSEEAAEAAEELARLSRREVTGALDRDAAEQAAAMQCTFGLTAGRGDFLVRGRDVASQLIGDSIIRRLQRDRAHYERVNGPAATGAALTAEEREAAEKEQRRQQREQDEEHRRAALAHNDALGAEVARRLARLDPADPRVVQLLAAAAPLRDLRDIASRGARYAMPGWVTTTDGKRGPKATHLSPAEATERAGDYLAAVTDPAEVAGRLVSLLALARYADDRAVARSHRVYYHLRDEATPWGGAPVDLLDDLCGEQLPGHLIAQHVAQRAEEVAEEAERLRREQERRDRIEHALDHPDDVTDEERAQVLADADALYGSWSARYAEIAKALGVTDTDEDADAYDDEEDAAE